MPRHSPAPWPTSPAHHISLVLDVPAPGTAFIAAEGHRDEISVSIWSYLYGPEAAEIRTSDEPAWMAWLSQRGIAPDGAD